MRWFLVLALSGCSLFGSDREEVTDDTSACEEDDERCAGDDASIERCVDGSWERWTDCDAGCEMSGGVPECLVEEVGAR